MSNPTTEKAARLFSVLTVRHDFPGSPVVDLSIENDTNTITLEAVFADGGHARHDLDPTRGIRDLTRQAKALIDQHINK